MIRLRKPILAIALGLLASASLLASDPPHDTSRLIECKSCHTTHSAPAATLTAVVGNANLCMSCHMPTGAASLKPFAPDDQALPGQGLPAATPAAGTSHRWDSGPAGHLVPGTTNTSTGTITLSGAYAGAYATTIQIKISTAGQVGAARFDWQMTINGTTTWGAATTAVATSASPVALGATGISVTFANGAGNPSFALNDIFLVYARTETRAPVTAAMSLRLPNGQFMCSTCHDQHSQAAKPFDPASSATYTPGVTNNRHFQRVANDTDQMCVDCHNPRNQTVKGGTTHPIALAIPATADYTTVRTYAKLDAASKVECQSCHKVHYAPTADGTLLPVSNAANLLCDDCHTYKTSATKGIHFDAALGVVWPGGQYGSTATTYAALAAGQRSNCANCHAPHGWPDARDTTKHYAKMLVDEPSNLCLTCHDSTPQGLAPNVQTEITKTIHHPIERTSGRTVSCGDCHNPHKALKGSHTYATTATSTRNLVSNVLKGVDGVTPTFGAAWTAATFLTTSAATKEYEICFKCHTSYSFGSTPPSGITTGGASPLTLVSGTLRPWVAGTGTAKFTNASTAVTGTGTTWITAPLMVGRYIRPTGSASTNYRVTAVGNATSLTLSTNFTQTTTAMVAYETRESASFAANSGTVTGWGTSWTTALMGQFIQNTSVATAYRITGVATATSLTITPNYGGTAHTYQDFYLHPGAGFTNGSTAVTGYGTNWNSSLVGNTIQANGQAGTNIIASVTDATHLTLTANFAGTTGIYRYLLAGPILLQETDLAVEFNPANKSGHPVAVGLSSYSGSTGTKNLIAGVMKAPWNVNVGAQTMMCSDCHNTDGAAAQGPHGSAAQFMLKGTNPGNWPAVTLSARTTSWCFNCHALGTTAGTNTNNVHLKGDHSSQPCYACHIVIPHGGKMSRLIGDQNGTMPARYAYNNDLNTMQITSFNKKSPNGYTETDCGARCDTGKHPLSTGENW